MKRYKRRSSVSSSRIIDPTLEDPQPVEIGGTGKFLEKLKNIARNILVIGGDKGENALDSKHAITEELELLADELKSLRNIIYPRDGTSDSKHARELEVLETELKKLQNKTNLHARTSDSEQLAREREKRLEWLKRGLKTELNQQNDTNRQAGASNSEHVATEREKQLELLLEKTQTELKTLKGANAKLREEKRLAAEKAVECERVLSAYAESAEANLRSSNKANQEEKKVMRQDAKRHKEKLTDYEGLMDDLMEERNDLKNKNLSKNRQIQELRGQVQGYQREMHGLQDQVRQYQSDIDELNREVFNNKIEISELEDRARHAQSNIGELRNTIDSLQSEIRNLKQQCDSFKRNHETAEKDLNRLQSQIVHIDRGVNPFHGQAYYIEIFVGLESILKCQLLVSQTPLAIYQKMGKQYCYRRSKI